MSFSVKLRGRGSVEVAAYGVADAEHRVEKEILRMRPEAAVTILQVRRPDAPSRIAERFAVEYRFEIFSVSEEETAAAARAAALRSVRSTVTASPYAAVALEVLSVEPISEPIH